jgi:hypothetical protein
MLTVATRTFLVAVVALVLTGCGANEYLGKPKEPEPNIVPANYRQEVLDTLRQTLDDPTNVRDAAISEPVLTMVGKEQRYMACVRANSRDSARQYLGIKVRVAYFFAGHLNQLVEATKEQCSGAAYKPYPELEKLCLGKTCE